MLASYQASLASELDGYLHQGSGANMVNNGIITSDSFNKGKITLLDKGSRLWLLYLLRFHLYPRKNQFHVCQCYKGGRKNTPSRPMKFFYDSSIKVPYFTYKHCGSTLEVDSPVDH